MKEDIEKEIVKREVGEKVQIKANFEDGSVKALGDGVLEAIVNTGQPDRQNETIKIDGVNFKDYKTNNPVVLYGHDYYSLPIGKALSVRKSDGGIVAKFQLATDIYDFAQTVYDMIQGGFLNAVSIGVIVKEWSADFTEILASEMVEFSVVPVPADRGALIQRSLGKSEDEFRNEYKDFVVKSLANKSSQDEIATHIKNLEALVALLKETHKESQNEAAPDKVKTIRKIVLSKTAGQLVKEAESTVHVLKVSLKS